MKAGLIFITASLMLTAGAANTKPRPMSDEVPPPEKMTTLIVYGDDPCPQSKSDEIVVCARQPENERYRVPKPFRGKKPDPAQESWTNTVSALEYVGKAGTPNSCSPVGSGGQTGCYDQFLRQAREERRQSTQDGKAIP